MNPKDIVYKMVVLGRRLTTHFILDIFWGSSFMFHVVLGFWLLARALQPKLTVNHGDEVGVNPPIDTSNNISPSTKGSGQVNHPYLK